MPETEPAEGGPRTIPRVVADNVLALRSGQRLGQEDVARRMQLLGHKWTAATVGEIEATRRSVRVVELVGLALVFGVPIGDLLDPTVTNPLDPVSIAGPGEVNLSEGTRVKAELIRFWVHGWRTARLLLRGDDAGVVFGFFSRFVPEPTAIQEGDQA